MKKYLISLGIVILSGTNALAADWSSLSIERHDLDVYNLINSPTPQVVSTNTDERSATVDYTESMPITVADKFDDPKRGNPDER